MGRLPSIGSSSSPPRRRTARLAWSTAFPLVASMCLGAAVPAAAPARAQSNVDGRARPEPSPHRPAPCADGIVFGNVTGFYQAVLGDHDHDGRLDSDETPSAYYLSMPEPMRRMVDCGADPARTVPDLFLYRERPADRGGLVRDEQGIAIGRVYGRFDGDTGRYHVALVLSGCYTDNVFASAAAGATDAGYLASVFWPFDHTNAASERSDELLAGFRRSDDTGALLHDYAPT